MANKNIDISNIPIHGFAAAALYMYQGELVEINTGEIKTTHVLDQFSHDIKHLIRGKIIDAIGDALVVDCIVEPGVTRKALINCWSIKSICILDNRYSLSDVYWDADKKHTNK